MHQIGGIYFMVGMHLVRDPKNGSQWNVIAEMFCSTYAIAWLTVNLYSFHIPVISIVMHVENAKKE